MIYAARRVAGCDCAPRRMGTVAPEPGPMDWAALKEFSAQNPEGVQYEFVGGTTLADVIERREEPAKTAGGGSMLLLFVIGWALAKSL